MYHVYPVNDEREHELEGTMCPCGPRVEWSDPKTGAAYAEALVIHNAFDCREIVEEAERILANIAAQARRGKDVQHGTETQSRRCLEQPS